MFREVAYQLYLAFGRGKEPNRSKDIDSFKNRAISLENNEEVSPQSIRFDLERRDIINLVDYSLPHILNIDQTDTGSELSQGLFRAKKLLLAAEILNYSLFKHASIFVCHQAIKVAKKYHVLDVIFQANRILYSANRSLQNYKKSDAAIVEFKEYLKFYEIEKSIEIDLVNVLSREDKSGSINNQTAALCQSILDKYEQYFGIIPSYNFHNAIFTIRYIKEVNKKNPYGYFKVASEMSKWFGQLEFKFMPALYQSYAIQVLYCVQVRDFKKGIEINKEGKGYFPKNTLGYFNFIRSEVVLHLHQGTYDHAIELVFKTLNHKKFDLMAPVFKRDWYLYEAYVNLLLETGYAHFEGRRRRFSIQRFINDLPDYSKDKRAKNIPILIAQMLFFITRKQYNNAIDRIESLSKYTSRYLRNNDTFRSMCFIKMILEIPKWSFNRLRVERATAHLHIRLLESELNLVTQAVGIEIIPYEKLWEIIMNELRPDHNYKPKKERIPQEGRMRQAQGG